MEKYFEVIAKCGHVGRNYYYEGHFFVKANNGRDAAQDVRYRPRVKHDRKDAILAVIPITKEQYHTGYKREKNNPYFKCENVQQQRDVWEAIKPWVYPESGKENRTKKGNHGSEKKEYSKNKKIRNPYKYSKINGINIHIDLELLEA